MILSTRRLGYAYVAPTYLVLGLVLMVPAIQVVVWSFTNDAGGFVGLHNYVRQINTYNFQRVILNMVKFSVVSILLTIVVGLIAALLLNRIARGERLFTILLLVPWVSSLVVSCMSWRWMLDSQYGLVTYMLRSVGLVSERAELLSNPNTAIYILAAINAWHLFPFAMMVISAALKNIPHEVIEAAEIDGAGPTRMLFEIKLPLLRPVLTVIVIYTAIWTANAYTIPMILTGGGPVRSSETIAMYILDVALGAFDFPGGAAVSVIMMAVVLAMIVAFIAIRNRNSEAGDVI